MIKNLHTTFKKGIILPSIIFIATISFFAAVFPIQMGIVLDAIKNFIFENLNWVFVWATNIFIVFLVF